MIMMMIMISNKSNNYFIHFRALCELYWTSPDEDNFVSIKRIIFFFNNKKKRKKPKPSSKQNEYTNTLRMEVIQRADMWRSAWAFHKAVLAVHGFATIAERPSSLTSNDLEWSWIIGYHTCSAILGRNTNVFYRVSPHFQCPSSVQVFGAKWNWGSRKWIV